MEKIVFETFRGFGSYDVMNLTHSEPSSLNGMVKFKKYRVSIEPIEEPVEVYQERLQALWDICDNHHQWRPLESAAKSIGYELQGKAGNKRKTK